MLHVPSVAQMMVSAYSIASATSRLPFAAVVAHPRISVNSISSLRQPFADDVALWSELGITHVGLISPKLDAAGWDTSRRLVLDAGLRVSSLSAFLEEPVDWEFATAVDCDLLYTVSGGGGMAPWENAAAHFCEAIQPWGGYSGIFIDPDGHTWEVAYIPFWILNDDGTVSLPDRSGQ